MKTTAKRSYGLLLPALMTLAVFTGYARKLWLERATTPKKNQPVFNLKTKTANPSAPLQTGGSFDLTQSSVLSGGGTSSGGNITLLDAVGYPLAGLSTGGTYTLTDGFLPVGPTASGVITVNTTADAVAADGLCSLREAITAANTNSAFGGCAAGTAGLDNIVFNLPGGGTSSIALLSALPAIMEPVTIDGATGGATRIELNGINAGSSANGLLITAGNSTLSSLVINRFSLRGIYIQTGGGNTVQNCYIGLNSAGNVGAGNGQEGIIIDGSSGNVIGGTTPGTRNVVSGNNRGGVYITNSSANNQVLGNYIGTNAAGTAGILNEDGVVLENSSNNVVGGAATGAGNLIAFNRQSGVLLIGTTSVRNRVSGNLISSNGARGIALTAAYPPVAAPTANDAGDADTGTNNLQNFPVINAVTAAGLLTGTIDSTIAASAYPLRLEFFANTFCDPSGNGEGEVFLGSVSQAAPGAFTFNFTPVAGKPFITATATDNNGNTSEFSACRMVGNAPAQNIIVNTTADTVAADGGCSLREAIQAVNVRGTVNECSASASGPYTITFNIPGTGTPTINVGNALPAIIEPVTIDGGAARVELNGGNLGANRPGLNITAGNSTVRALVINRFSGAGIQISGQGGNTLQNCLIGLNAAGTAAQGNDRGIVIDNVPNNLIGGTTASARNVIAGNAFDGVQINGLSAMGNLVLGNFIGTDVTGTLDLGNNRAGVKITDGQSNIIGGSQTETRNVIAGNNGCGVEINQVTASGNEVLGNYIGTNAGGTAAIANGTGVCINAARNNNIGGSAGTTPGGTCTGACNLISGNTQANVSILNAPATGNRVIGNLIGLNAAGTVALANPGKGVDIVGASDNIIGGTMPALRNVISGHASGAGVSISSASNNQVRGNYIGTNAAGTGEVANAIGVSRVESSLGTGQNNVIGGADAGMGNVISGNTSAGIQLQGQNDFVWGNLIGLRADGVSALGNGVGINLNNGTAQNNIIGDTDIRPGACSGKCNKIAFNLQQGVLISTNGNTGNRIIGNSIFSNGALGIDLAPTGVTPNDPDDGDSGPNGLQNFPVISAALTLGSGDNRTTTFQGTLNSATSTLYRIEFFSNTTCDAGNNCEGQNFLGFTNVTTDGAGNAVINVTLPTPSGIAAGNFVTATATDVTAMNTSEFSAGIPVFSFNPATAAFNRFTGTGSFTLATEATISWTAVSSAPWLIVATPAGRGNGTVGFSLAANPNDRLRTATINVNGNFFIVTQTGTTGMIVLEDFAIGNATFVPGQNWTITDGGTNGGVEARWNNQNPCNRRPGGQFTPSFAIADAGCAKTTQMNEYLFTPPFNATGLGTVTIQFINQFDWDASAPNIRGDVDVSIDGGMNWTNVLRLEGKDYGVPTPDTQTIDITDKIRTKPDNVLVRMHYYDNSPGSAPFLPENPPENQKTLSPTSDLFGYWAVDFTIAGYGINPLTASVSGNGGAGSLKITVPPTDQPSLRAWSVTSNAAWITNVTPASGTTETTVTYQVAPNPGSTSRTGTLTITGNNGFTATHTVTQSSGNCPAITVNPATLTAGTQGTAYNQTFTQTGGSGTIPWAISAGALPADLTINSG
ncbi:MAG TPA: CSLREA domain-containing protein, partial [Blastocatellia bacterium]|nr:CSLREA domain-containing protein [Blastocatellia bacterium]